MMEMALLSPWFIFLFVGALDWGFYAYSLITVETAARTAAAYIVSQNNPSLVAGTVTSANACTYALPELSTLINIGSTVTTCDATPLVVSASQITSVDGNQAVQVNVTYTTPQLVPIPGLLAGKFTITRVVKMRLI